MELYNDYYDDYLMHHGTKGMRWGVRRYQNKDGSLTAAGKKRRSLGQVVHDRKVAKKRKAAAAKARETREKNLKEAAKRKEALAKGKIPAKKMTDAELADSLKRLENEAKYKQKVLETSPGKRMAHEMWDKAIVPGISEGAKQLIKDTLIKKGSKALGLEEKKVKSEYDKLKEAKEMSDFKKQIQVNQDYFTNRQKKLQKEAEERAKADAQKKVDDYNEQQEKNYQKNRTDNSGQYHMKGDGASGNKSGSENKSDSSSNSTKGIPGPTKVDPGTSMSTVRSTDTHEGQAYVQDSSGKIITSTTYREED